MSRLRRQQDHSWSALEDVAQVTQRLAVLLTAGVSPTRAWGYLLPFEPAGAETVATAQATTRPSTPTRPSTQQQSDPIIRAAARAGAQGESIADAIGVEARALGGQVGEAWLDLAAAWSVATQAGAPLARCLRDLAETFRQVGELHRDLDVALAGPAASARMVLALPAVGVLFGSLMGFNTLQTLFLTVPGLICVGGGALLLLAGARWNRRLVRAAQARDPAPGLELDLVAVAMAGGGSVDRARALVTLAGERFVSGRIGSDPTLASVLDLSIRAGVPAAELLRSEADQLRRDARSHGQRRAAALAVTLMIPLGVCVLPAFMVVGVVPLLLTVLSSTLSTF